MKWWVFKVEAGVWRAVKGRDNQQHLPIWERFKSFDHHDFPSWEAAMEALSL